MRTKQYKSNVHELIHEAETILVSDLDESFKSRVRLVLKVLKGSSTKDVAQEAGRKMRTIERWRDLVDNYGFDSLRFDKGPGRNPTLSDSQLQEVKRIVTQTFPFEYNGLYSVHWTGDNLATVLSDVFPGIRITSRHCREYLKSMEYSKSRRYPCHTLNRALNLADKDTALRLLSLIRNGEPEQAVKRECENAVNRFLVARNYDPYNDIDDDYDDYDDDWE